MILRIENENGCSADIGSKHGLKLLEYPDFGNIKTDIITERIPGIKGELVRSVDSGSRDICLKIETGIVSSYISRVFAEGSRVTLFINGSRYINGIISGVSFSRPSGRDMYRAMNVIIRCPDPFFRKTGAAVTASFSNSGGGIYENGDYTYTRLVLHNEGDIPCPVKLQMACTADSYSALSGLMTYIDWNSGNPLYKGIIFKNGTEPGIEHYITTDIASERFFESWAVLKESDYFHLPPGDTELFAQNVQGTISLDPLFLLGDGGDE